MRLGIDVGGTKIEAIVLSDTGVQLARLRKPTPAHDYTATLQTITSLVEEIEARTGQRGTVGIGMPGAIDARTGLIKNANSTWLNDRPMDKDLERKLARPVRLQNDANCFALSEAVDGAGQGFEIVFGVIVGTGCGGGFAVNAKPLQGANRITGEWGHNPLPAPRGDETPGPECYCGKIGCIETWLSGPGFVRSCSDDKSLMPGETLTAQSICKAAEEEHEPARRALGAYADRMARALAAIVNIIDPDVIVLGGGMSNVAALYDMVPPLMVPHIMSDNPLIRLRRNVHGDSSGVRGAAWLWPKQDIGHNE